MRIELDKPLTKTKLRQILKMAGKDGKAIKVIMGTEIFDIDTVVTKNETIYLCTDSKETSDFYEKRVIEDLPKEIVEIPRKNMEDYQDPDPQFKPTYISYSVSYDDNGWQKAWKKYCDEHGLPYDFIGDTPGFGDDIR